MNNIEIIKIELSHDDLAMNEQIGPLTEGDLVERSIDYFQKLSRLGFYTYIYFRKKGHGNIQTIAIEDGYVDDVGC